MRKQREHWAHDFAQTLARQYTPHMVWQHEQILALLIDCVCRETDVRRIKDPTRGIAHSHVRQWYQRKVGDRTASEPKTTVKRFCHVYGAMLTAKETL